MQVHTLAEQLYFTTIRIDTNAPGGGHGSGTGFFFDLMVDGQKRAFIVTNKHVVFGQKGGRVTFIRQKDDGQPSLGDGFNLEISEADWAGIWFGHPDPEVDIAICDLHPFLSFMHDHHGVIPFVRCIGSELIPTEEQKRSLDAMESVTFIGYPNGIWDSKNLLPVMRQGTTATPITVDFEQTPRFLIDASVFGGSSGSPVFLFNQGSYPDKAGGLIAGSRLYFLGVVAAVFFRTHLNEIVAIPIPTHSKPMAQQQEMIDLGVVFKAHTVVETIDAFLAQHPRKAN
ncbi:serine protease [Pseudomonas putida]|uniref:Serine protease n=1 Tax=Pseudomonas putida TaxID=303 RepID=A0A2Z4REI2_PSEPU|nr:trypsin-like peptidase domain-containing protein [Pseudomonas putida]AWY39402.1 serine protease [Pseudomonas putida]